MTRTKKRDKRRWRLTDQIAFECALAQDEREDWQRLKDRDREIARALAQSDWESEDRRSVFRPWLAARLHQTPSIKLAADSLRQSISTAGQLLCVLGTLLGLGTATAALAYTGQEPINVSAFFAVFVLLQAVLAVALLVPFLLPQSLRERMLSGPLPRFAKFVFDQTLKKTHALANRFLEARHRSEAAEIAGIARSRLSLHRSLFRWLAFRKLQAAALCFNIGALTALLVAVAFSDRAFGWQTTLNVAPESVHELTQYVASPWAWFYGEGRGYPALPEVEGSRIVLKDGIRALRTESLVAWWQFLALGIVTYGVFPRLLLWILGELQTRRALRNYDFGNAAAQRLLDRLAPHAPRFDVEAVNQAESAVALKRSVAPDGATRSNQTVLGLVDQELAKGLDLTALRKALASRWSVAEENVDALAYAARELNGVADASDVDQFALVVESWMPPIRETERMLKSLRSTAGERRLIRIVLLGLPDEATGQFSLSPAANYANTWDAFVRRQGDPYLILDNPA